LFWELISEFGEEEGEGKAAESQEEGRKGEDREICCLHQDHSHFHPILSSFLFLLFKTTWESSLRIPFVFALVSELPGEGEVIYFNLC
jgi:hypothetical protein